MGWGRREEGCCNGMGSEGIMEQVFLTVANSSLKQINHLQNNHAVFVEVREY